MKVILTLKEGNKSPKNFCKEVEVSPQEYDQLKDICRTINSKSGEECVSAYVFQI